MPISDEGLILIISAEYAAVNENIFATSRVDILRSYQP